MSESRNIYFAVFFLFKVAGQAIFTTVAGYDQDYFYLTVDAHAKNIPAAKLLFCSFITGEEYEKFSAGIEDTYAQNLTEMRELIRLHLPSAHRLRSRNIYTEAA